MALKTHTLTLPVHPLHLHTQPSPDWRGQWRYEADMFTRTLGPRQGVLKIQLNHDAGTATIDYDPTRFSLDQLKALGREMGLVVGGAVYHTILDLPQCGRRAAMAHELERRLKEMPGVAHAALNPQGRVLTIEYLTTAPASAQADVLSKLREWGFFIREPLQPAEWWTQNRLAVYTVLTALTLAAGWLTEHVFQTSPWVWGALYVLAFLFGGGFATMNALQALRRKQIDVDLLMVAAALGAAFIGDWVEGGVLLFLFALSNALEHYAMGRTRQAIRALMDLRPATARVRREGREAMVPVEELNLGDVLEVHPSEKLPADGEVVAGESAVDQSPITGESIPVPRGPGDPVFAGSINGGGALEVRVTKRAADSTLARIIQLVEEAQSERAPTQRRLDDLEQRYAVGVISFATLVALVPPLLLGWTWSAAFYKSMMLLVVASPCALVISTPASILSAIAAGARRGVLFKGGAHVESLASVRVVAFDKTGTLTAGRPRVTDVCPTANFSETELLTLAAAVESRSEHPLARAVVAAAMARGLQLPEAADLQAIPGKGVSARITSRHLPRDPSTSSGRGGQLVERAHHLPRELRGVKPVEGEPVEGAGFMLKIGTIEHLVEQGVTVTPEHLQLVEKLWAEGKTVMLIGDDQLLGIIAVADTVRPEAPAAVAALKAAGVIKVVMLTGDNERAAQAIGAAAGVDEVYAELLPEDKVDAVKNLLRDYGSVAMVGDGVNDAPALASATVGIAMGTGGTDVALETADVVLMSSDLSQLPYALRLSRRAMSIVRQNLTFAMAVIILLISSAFLNILSLPWGVVGHEGSTVIVVLNGLRLLGYKPKR